MLKISVLGQNGTTKARIIDDIDEYLKYAGLPVNNELENEIDELANLRYQIVSGFVSETEKILLAHVLIVKESYLQLPKFDILFWFPTQDMWRIYQDLIDEYDLDVVHLPRDGDKAADKIRLIVEGRLSDDNRTAETEARTSVRRVSDDGRAASGSSPREV